MTTLAKRLDTHFAACAAAAAGAAMLGGAQEANAAIVYSGLVNISIPNTFAGVYLNIVTGLTTGSGSTNVGMDFNPYNGGGNMWQGPGTANRAVAGVPATSAANLAFGAPINGASPFVVGAFPTMGNFAVGVSGYFGLRFLRESDSATLYGWVRMTKGTNPATPGLIHEYAYDDAATGGSILAGQVPGPGSLALLALGALSLRGRKRN